MEDKINACQTLAELAELERTHSLNEEERRLVFERLLWMFLQVARREFLDTQTTQDIFAGLAR